MGYIQLNLWKFDHLMDIKRLHTAWIKIMVPAGTGFRFQPDHARRLQQFLPMPFVSLLALLFAFTLFGIFLRLFKRGVRGRRLVGVPGIPIQPRFDLFDPLLLQLKQTSVLLDDLLEVLDIASYRLQGSQPVGIAKRSLDFHKGSLSREKDKI